MWKVVVAAAMTFGLVSCASPYVDGSNPLAVFGGYWHLKGPGKLTTVGFSGNGYTSKDLTKTYVLRRCAELAKEANKAYFVIYDSPADAVANRPMKDIDVFSFGSKPTPIVYMLPQENASTYSFETELILAAKAEEKK